MFPDAWATDGAPHSLIRLPELHVVAVLMLPQSLTVFTGNF